ncbi:3-oxoacyl-ACP synthase [Proteus sp. G2626]|uniref:3-oxoacyl-ACP synthase n=1 Tax=Proteus sp. G2626 TaxID=2698842 RepID=UPI00137774E5|nr:3-oxoacyl-ACP synthase [Proteus sp. G2626]NBN46021.1 3-oxoacyl-ACP synthase [Proteus sp. G2626]
MNKEKYLSIISAGLYTPIGTDLPSTISAIRAGLDHFKETEFRDRLYECIIGSQLYECSIWGPARFIKMINNVINESIKNTNIDKKEIQLCLILPENNRPGIYDQWLDIISESILPDFHKTSKSLNKGKAGISEALELVNNTLLEKTANVALIVGCDSYFNAETINYYLNNNRLLNSENSDGFIPGEGAGAILLKLLDCDEKYISLLSFNTEIEHANILQTSLPLRSKALSNTINNTCKKSKIRLSDTKFVISNASGESFYFKEISLAITRTLKEKTIHYPHLMIAKNIGETGAASNIIILATLSAWIKHPEFLGKSGLMISCADSGERTTIILQYQTKGNA